MTSIHRREYMDRKKTTQLAKPKMPLKVGLPFRVTKAAKPTYKSAAVKI